MDWTKGFGASYYACMVNPETWQDASRFEITEGSVNRVNTGLRHSADIVSDNYDGGSDKWIRIWMDVEQDGSYDHIAIFTGLTSTPKESIDGATIDKKIQCYSVLKSADDVRLPIGWYAARGFVATDVIKQLLSVCPAPVDIAEGSPRLSQHIIAENNETNATMVDKVLNAIGWRLWIGGDGVIHICPKAEDVSAVFSSIGSDCIEPPVDVADDMFSCPNVLRVTSGDNSVTVYDDDPESRLSTVSRGREVWNEESSAKLGDGESLRSYAKRRLKELQSVSVKLSYSRSYHPNVTVTDLVRLHYPEQGIEGIFSVASQKISLDHRATTAEEAMAA